MKLLLHQLQNEQRLYWRSRESAVFTFIFPIALMTTTPALALLGRLDARTAAAGIVGGIAFAAMARWVWRRALGMYTSASS